MPATTKMAMTVRALLIASTLMAGAAAVPAADAPNYGRDRGQGHGPDHGQDGGQDGRPGKGRHGGPEILIDPSYFIERRQKVDVSAPGFVMGEIKACAAAGTLLFVDCLRANHGSIMIRKLEACVQSEVIPPDMAMVEPCLPMVAQP